MSLVRIVQPQLIPSSFSGIATHYVDSSVLPDLEARLAELNFADFKGQEERLAVISNTIEEFNTGLPHDQNLMVNSDIRRAIDYVFHPSNKITDILSALEETKSRPAVPENVQEWASKTLATIRERSPTSVGVTLRQLKEGRNWNIFQTFQHEYHISSRFMSHNDFVTGVTARLITKEKGRPKWSPNQLEDVTDEQVAEFFTTEPAGLQVLNTEEKAQYKDYPYASIGLPRERDVEKFISTNSQLKRTDIVEYFLGQTEAKMGVREKVEEILDRKTETTSKGTRWLA